MALILTLCFAFLMFYLAHSMLLHYLVEDAGGVPIEAGRIVLPWPAKGRIGAGFAALTGTPFLFAALFMVPFRPVEAERFWSVVFLLTVMFILPAGHYAWYLWRRLVREGGKGGSLMFVPAPATPGEYAFPLACAAVFNGVCVLVDLLT